MKKIILGLALAVAFTGFVGVSHASAASCGEVDPATNTVVVCGNGPIQPQLPGGRFLKAGDEDCPAWFPFNSGHTCYTFRAVGSFFVR